MRGTYSLLDLGRAHRVHLPNGYPACSRHVGGGNHALNLQQLETMLVVGSERKMSRHAQVSDTEHFPADLEDEIVTLLHFFGDVRKGCGEGAYGFERHNGDRSGS